MKFKLFKNPFSHRGNPLAHPSLSFLIPKPLHLNTCPKYSLKFHRNPSTYALFVLHVSLSANVVFMSLQFFINFHHSLHVRNFSQQFPTATGDVLQSNSTKSMHPARESLTALQKSCKNHQLCYLVFQTCLRCAQSVASPLLSTSGAGARRLIAVRRRQGLPGTTRPAAAPSGRRAA